MVFVDDISVSADFVFGKQPQTYIFVLGHVSRCLPKKMFNQMLVSP